MAYTAAVKTFLLVGNYGVGNLGDEALRDYFLRSFPEVRFRVLSAHPGPEELYRLPGGLRSLFRPWWRTVKALKEADGVVFGGGSLFTDVESLYACFLWWLHVAAARLFGKPVHLAFQGIGPFQTAFGERLARSAVRMGASVSVRDKASLQRVDSFSLNKKIILTFDPVYKEIMALNREKNEQRIHNLITVIPRSNPSKTFYKALEQHITSSAEGSIISLQPDNRAEQRACQEIARRFTGEPSIVPVRTLRELIAACACSRLILTQRYHAALVARALEIPVEIVAQGADDKLSMLRADDPTLWVTRIEAGEKALRAALA